MTTLVIVLFLDAMFGGTIRAEVTYLTPAACQQMLTTVRKLTVPHVVERDCAPAPEDAAPIPFRAPPAVAPTPADPAEPPAPAAPNESS